MTPPLCCGDLASPHPRNRINTHLLYLLHAAEKIRQKISDQDNHRSGSSGIAAAVKLRRPYARENMRNK
jgi:hypothetical protein